MCKNAQNHPDESDGVIVKEKPPADLEPSGWLAIDPDGTITAYPYQAVEDVVKHRAFLAHISAPGVRHEPYWLAYVRTRIVDILAEDMRVAMSLPEQTAAEMIEKTMSLHAIANRIRKLADVARPKLRWLDGQLLRVVQDANPDAKADEEMRARVGNYLLESRRNTGFQRDLVIINSLAAPKVE